MNFQKEISYVQGVYLSLITQVEAALKKKSEGKAMKREAEKLHNELKNSEAQVEELKAEMCALRENLEEWKKHAVQKKKDGEIIKERVKFYDKNVAAFRKHLGLEIKSAGDDTLLFAFTKINPKKHNQHFWFEISVKNRIYKYCDSKPEINYAPLLDELNKTDDFGAFICSLRAAFKATCI